MLLDGPTTWPSQDLMWRRFVVESSSRLWVRMIEGFILPREIELCKNKIKKLTYMWHMNWYFTMMFSTVITGTLKWLDVKKIKIEWNGDSDLLSTSSLDLLAVSYLSSNAESLVWTWRASLAGDKSLACFLLMCAMLEETWIYCEYWLL